MRPSHRFGHITLKSIVPSAGPSAGRVVNVTRHLFHVEILPSCWQKCRMYFILRSVADVIQQIQSILEHRDPWCFNATFYPRVWITFDVTDRRYHQHVAVCVQRRRACRPQMSHQVRPEQVKISACWQPESYITDGHGQKSSAGEAQILNTWS